MDEQLFEQRYENTTARKWKESVAPAALLADNKKLSSTGGSFLLWRIIRDNERTNHEARTNLEQNSPLFFFILLRSSENLESCRNWIRNVRNEYNVYFLSLPSIRSATKSIPSRAKLIANVQRMTTFLGWSNLVLYTSLTKHYLIHNVYYRVM